MRFISIYRRFSVGIQPRLVEVLAGGAEKELQPEVTAEFWQGDLMGGELEFAERHWPKVHGRTTEMDTVTLTPLVGRLSTFDSEQAAIANGWDDATKRQVEEKLLARARNSRSFAVIEAAPLSPPWPRYDDFQGSFADLVEKVVEDGHNPGAVAAYERQNLNRQVIVEMLEEIQAERQALLQPATEADVIPA